MNSMYFVVLMPVYPLEKFGYKAGAHLKVGEAAYPAMLCKQVVQEPGSAFVQLVPAESHESSGGLEESLHVRVQDVFAIAKTTKERSVGFLQAAQ